MSTGRLVAGFLIAPIVPALFILGGQATVIARGHAEWGTINFVIIGYVTAGVVGIPAYFAFREVLRGSLIRYVPAGTLIGMVPVCALFLPIVVLAWSSQHEHAVALLANTRWILLGGVFLGGLSSMVFWLIAIRGR